MERNALLSYLRCDQDNRPCRGSFRQGIGKILNFVSS